MRDVPATPPDPSVDYDREPARRVCVIDMASPLRSKSNYRRAPKGSRRGGDWNQHRAFEEELALLARLARPPGWPMGSPTEAVAARPTVVVLIVARTLLDTANMAKSVTDALEGVLFLNDASVRHVACVSTRARSDQDVTLLVEALAPGAPLSAVFETAQRLGADYSARDPTN